MEGRTFEWDEAKAAANIAKHGLPFPDALAVFLDPLGVDYDASRPQDGEARRKVVGRLETGLSTVVYTLRGDAVRIISARRANAEEERPAMATVRYVLDPANPPKMSEETRARLEAMTDEEITAAALSDPENPPLTDDEFARIRAIRIARRARERAGLTQAAFAKAYAVNLARLRDLEQGRKTPDSVLVSFLALIADDPERTRQIVSALA